MNRKDRRNYAKKINTPQKLESFSMQLERKIRKECDEKYKKFYEENLSEAIDTFVLTIIYTLHYHEKTKFGNGRIADFMEDLFETVDMFRRDEALPEDYIKQLEEDGIKIIRSKESKKND